MGHRWGIMGSGGIATQMARTLRQVGSPLVAVGSGRPGAAEAFAAEWDVEHALDSHESVASHPDVDIVYVATTNDRHLDNALACVAAGTPVLCEKPLTVNADQARTLTDRARQAGVLLMEAMWMRFLPVASTMLELVEAGTVGEVRHIDVTFGHLANLDPDRRWMRRDLGGGSLLDLGIYPLSLIHLVAGPPTSFEARADLADNGVDLQTQVISSHGGGVGASMMSSFLADAANEAVIAGSEGRLRLLAPFHHSGTVVVERKGEIVEQHDTSYEGEGFAFEVAEMERCVTEGLVESPLRPHADTLAVLEWMDAIRSRVGLIYPEDG